MDTFFQLVTTTIASSNIAYFRWVTEELFSPAWLIIAAGLALSVGVLFLLIDRSRLREIILFGALLSFLFGYTDVIATGYGLWAYKTHIIPATSSVFPFSYTMNPVFHMLAYQYGGSWRRFAVLNGIVAALFAFMAHPFYVWADVLWLGKWNHLASFIYLLTVPLAARAFILWLANIEQHAVTDRQTSVFAPLQPAMKFIDHEKDKDK